MKWRHALTILFLGIVGTFLQIDSALAYSYNIKCPKDQDYYVVVYTPSSQYETTGVPDFEPFQGQEICFPVKGASIKQLADSKVLQQGVFFNKGVSNVEILECSEALFNAGSDKFDWDNLSSDWQASYDESFKLYDKANPVPSCNDNKPRRIRYQISNYFFYNVGKYSEANVSTDNPEALKGFCLGFKTKDDCNAQSDNCQWNQSCKPKSIAEEDFKKQIEDIKNPNTPEEQIICSSTIEKIQAKCASEPSLCQSTCQQYSKCVYFDGKCDDKANLTQEQLRSIAVSAADNYLKAKYPVPKGYLSKILPECAFSGTCRSIDDLLILGINIAKFLFSLIGTIAFVMFVYGGTRFLISGGSPSGIQAGKDAMVHAVIGIIISFSAYMIVSFVLNLLQVGAQYKAIGYLASLFV